MSKTINVRLLEHRKERNKNRPALDALLKEFDCDHATLTTAYGTALKDTTDIQMKISVYGHVLYENNLKRDSRDDGWEHVLYTRRESPDIRFEFEEIPISADMWRPLARAVLTKNNKDINLAFAEMLSTATH